MFSIIFDFIKDLVLAGLLLSFMWVMVGDGEEHLLFPLLREFVEGMDFFEEFDL